LKEGEALVPVGLHGTIAMAVSGVYAAGPIVIEMSNADQLVRLGPLATAEEDPDLLVESKLMTGSGDATLRGALGLNAAHVHDGVGIGDVGVGGADALVVAGLVGTVDGVQMTVLSVLVVGDAKDLTPFAEVRTTVPTSSPGIDVVAL
jgi:hypothetical protein